MKAVRESMAFPDLSTLGQEVRLDASYFTSPHSASRQPSSNQEQMPAQQNPPPPPSTVGPPTAPKPNQNGKTHKISGADLASYQFPVDDDEPAPPPEASAPSHQQPPASSAFKKEGTSKKKTPVFQEK